ncbi:uncharacterized protein G2W53_024383 [Senna tora]|uniref:Uncharacterized protein n=1 Tax=Senna tora TaxID=362788 RepID=A0A834WFF0_9FABA|nr:uncharacterized protein G2W53_024383 [Senna tora]
MRYQNQFHKNNTDTSMVTAGIRLLWARYANSVNKSISDERLNAGGGICLVSSVSASAFGTSRVLQW